MALTKVTVEDKIEILELGQIQVRTATKVFEDDVELSQSFHRHTVVPSAYNFSTSAWVDTDTSAMSAKVQALAAATWTAETVAAFKTKVGTDSSI